MFVNAQDQESGVALKSSRLQVAIWRRFAEDFKGAHIEDREALSVAWAHTPFPFWNVIFLSTNVHRVEQLRAAADESAAIAATKEQSGLICVCSSLLDGAAGEQLVGIMSAVGYPVTIPITGMTAGHFPITHACPKSLRIERVSDFRILTELNCHAYAVPPEAARPSTLSEQLAQRAFIYLGYEADRPVSTAAVIVHEDVLYLALVATDANARGKGYGEAIVRHSLQKAHEATGLTQAALHATELGKPIYEHIGFQPVAEFRWYMQKHD
jgi:GNAT superfamily N-acetyltransferase